jgi:predicted nucleic acid-binding protein
VCRKIRDKTKDRKKFISTVVIYELYRLTLLWEEKETAMLRVTLLKKEFQAVPVDDQIAQVSAELHQKYKLSMDDSMIAATAYILSAVCFSDDPHFEQIKEIKTTWIQ